MLEVHLRTSETWKQEWNGMKKLRMEITASGLEELRLNKFCIRNILEEKTAGSYKISTANSCSKNSEKNLEIRNLVGKEINFQGLYVVDLGKKF